LEKVGGFDERFVLPWREDSDLFFTLLEQGHQVARAPDAVVVHTVRPASRETKFRHYRKAMYDALLYKKHPLLFRQNVRTRTPWHYYGVVVALVLLVYGSLSSLTWLSVVSGAQWLVLTGVFIWQRWDGSGYYSMARLAEIMVAACVIPLLALYWRLRGAIAFRVWYF
jgi:hypothetical protein